MRRLLRHGAGARSRAAQCVLRPSSPRPCRITRPEFSVFRNGSQEYAKNGVCVGFAHKSKRFRVVPLISGGFGVVKRSGVRSRMCHIRKTGRKKNQSPSQNSLSHHPHTSSPGLLSAPLLRPSCASVLHRRADHLFSSHAASRAQPRNGSICTPGSALWIRCPLLLLRSALLSWRSFVCGLRRSFSLGMRKRISGRSWVSSSMSPTLCATSLLCIAFATTSPSRHQAPANRRPPARRLWQLGVHVW